MSRLTRRIKLGTDPDLHGYLPCFEARRTTWFRTFGLDLSSIVYQAEDDPDKVDDPDLFSIIFRDRKLSLVHKLSSNRQDVSSEYMCMNCSVC